MKTFDELREGFKTDANRKAAFAKMNDKKTSEALNKDDKPFVKKLVGKLRKGSKTHAKQADDLEKAMTTEVKQPPKKEVMKVIGHTKNAVQGRAALRKKYGVSDKEADDIIHKAMTEGAVNELDTSTLISYRKKANKQRYSNNISKRSQRTTGVDMANKKLRKRNIDKFGKHSPKGVDKMGNPKEDSDAVKAFLAKGGKIKKLPPAKAQGYHGKDDPGKGMHGMMDRPDTKAIGTRKKVKSMESLWDNIRKKRERIKRGSGERMRKPGEKGAPKTLDIGENYIVKQYKDGKKTGVVKRFNDLKKATAHAKQQGGDHRVHKESGPFGPGPSISKVGVRVMKKGKEVPPTPPKIGVVSYTGGRKDKLPPHLSGKKEGYKSYAQQKAVWASRADAKKKGKK